METLKSDVAGAVEPAMSSEDDSSRRGSSELAETVQDLAASVKEVIKGSLIVNYIPANMTDEGLRALFGSIGPLKSCRIMTDKWTGLGLGYGFMEFVNSADAQAAIDKMNGFKIQGKSLKVSVSRPSSIAITNANLYIKGLPLTMTPPDLKAVFAKYGEIIAVRVILPSTDTTASASTNSNANVSAGAPEGQQKRSVGFVRFDKRKDAEVALAALNGTTLEGCTSPLHIKFADHRPRTLEGGYPATAHGTEPSRECVCILCCSM